MSNEMTSTANDTHQLPIPQSLITELAGLRALEHLDREDRSVPLLIYNAKWQLADGSWVRKDAFVNSLTEEVKPVIRSVLLDIRKTRRYAIYTEGSGFSVRCQSDDLIEGITHDGEVRECSNCTYKSWGNGQTRTLALIARPWVV